MKELEDRLHAIAPVGYSLALNIRRFTPEYYRSTYPDAWLQIYHERRYALFDPVTIWWRFNLGKIRWSAIDLGVLKGVGGHVMKHASHYGLDFGASVSYRGTRGKSLICGAREDREFTDEELDELAAVLVTISEAVDAHAALSAEEMESLRDLAQGLTHNEIADQRGISPATVKKRVERARKALGAKNAVHAVAVATKRGLIVPDPLF